MARFIDAEDVLETLSIDHGKRNDQEEKAILDAWDRIKKIPSADVEKVKHGHWENNLLCSVCGYLYDTGEYSNSHNYCPNCGAKMDGERRETDAE